MAVLRERGESGSDAVSGGLSRRFAPDLAGGLERAGPERAAERGPREVGARGMAAALGGEGLGGEFGGRVGAARGRERAGFGGVGLERGAGQARGLQVGVGGVPHAARRQHVVHLGREHRLGQHGRRRALVLTDHRRHVVL